MRRRIPLESRIRRFQGDFLFQRVFHIASTKNYWDGMRCGWLKETDIMNLSCSRSVIL